MLIPFHGLPPQKTAIAIFQEYSIVEQIKPPKTKTLKQKIKEDINGCEPKYYISAEDASCLPKPVYTQPKPKTRSKPIKNTSGNATAPAWWFPSDQCTSLVWEKRPVGRWSDAKNWLGEARRDGLETGATPRQGAIGWSGRGRWGHVVYVERVEISRIWITERNYAFQGNTRQRWANANEFYYIY